MRRRYLYLVAILGITATAGAGGFLAAPDGETPLWIWVNVADDAQPEQFTVAVGDMIEFAAGPLPPGADGVALRVQGEEGVLVDRLVTRSARFFEGRLYVQNGGLKNQAIRATKPGKAKVEVTTPLAGSRREIREFEITVVDKRKEKLPVKAMPIGPYGTPVPSIGVPSLSPGPYGTPAPSSYSPPDTSS